MNLGRLAAALCAVLACAPALATPEVHADYMLACQGCHVPDGSGFPAHGVPSLRGSVSHFAGVPGGREYLIRVPGVSQSGLSDERLAALLNWTLTTFDPDALPKDFQPYSAAEVQRWRHQPYADVTATRNQLLLRIEQKKKGEQ